MEGGLELVLARALTVDELLSDAFRPQPGQKSDADLAGRRLAAWCRASASGDWSLFSRRLQRDGLSIEDVLARFATVRRNPAVPAQGWMDDAGWVAAALHLPVDPTPNPRTPRWRCHSRSCSRRWFARRRTVCGKT